MKTCIASRTMNLPVTFSFALLITEIGALFVRHIDWFLARGVPRKRSRSSISFSSSSPSSKQASPKRIVLIRHGKTYMNEYIGGGGITFDQVNFTDVFEHPEDKRKYYDSPLSEVGTQQAKSLNDKLKDLKSNYSDALDALGLSPSSDEDNSEAQFLDDIDLVVVSPLTRALETYELSLSDYVRKNKEGVPGVPVLAMSAASERLYLVSDLGKPRFELCSQFPVVDFDTAFWYDHDDGIESFAVKNGGLCDENISLDTWHFSPTKEISEKYVEWRPHSRGQVYACLGEPTEHFDRRMSDLYYWLDSRPENCIAIVCHAGVIEWLTSGEEFANCELRIQTFDSLRPAALKERRSQGD